MILFIVRPAIQHNEYRQFFPNLVIMGLGWLTRWDVRYEMWFSFLLASLTSFNVYRLGRLTLDRDTANRRLAFLLSNLLIFSPAQYLNWLVGEQLVYFFPAACVTTCLRIAYSKMSVPAKFALCACLSAVSTFSAANGIVCWVVVFPALVWAGPQSISRGTRLRLALACACGLALCAALYFYGYQSPPGHAPLTAVFERPLHAAAHSLSLLGSTLAGESDSVLVVAVGVGVILFSLFAAHALRLFRAGVDHARTRRAVGWMMLGAYSILSAAAVTLGRSGLGVSQSSASRYTTFTLFLIVSVIHLVALPAGGAAGTGSARKLLPSRLVPAAVAVMLCLHALASFIAIQQMGLFRTRLLQARACHMFINTVPDTVCLERQVYPDVPVLRDWSNALAALGFWRPGLLRSNRVEEFAAFDASASGDYGSFDILDREGESYRASGRASLPHRREPPDAVLLAYEIAGGGHVAFARAELKNRGYIFVRFWDQGTRQDPSWEKSFSASELPTGAAGLTAWAFDAETGRAFNSKARAGSGGRNESTVEHGQHAPRGGGGHQRLFPRLQRRRNHRGARPGRARSAPDADRRLRGDRGQRREHGRDARYP
ncbi:MAG: hypothetical protein LC802_07870 [Acidobacteria bacterium]|nr:hypothetical protein [Acidobacteriota bacterium]